MKKAIFLVIICGCAVLKPQAPDVGFVAQSLKEMKGITVAVLPFENKTDVLGADYHATDEFNLRLGMTGNFRMVERIRIKELFEEQDFDIKRIDDTSAVQIGKMLGAKAVILGSVTRFKPFNRPPEIPFDAFPVMMPVESEEDLAISLIANTAAALISFLSMKTPVAEIGVTVRMVDTETGEILWQARNSYRGDDKFLTKRRPRSEWDRLRKDVVFLTGVFAGDMVETLKVN